MGVDRVLSQRTAAVRAARGNPSAPTRSLTALTWQERRPHRVGGEHGTRSGGMEPIPDMSRDFPLRSVSTLPLPRIVLNGPRVLWGSGKRP